jgi:ribonuclease HI
MNDVKLKTITENDTITNTLFETDINNNYYSLFSDGGSRSNPGLSAIGGILYLPNLNILTEYSIFIGIATNNQAEYLSLIHGLLIAKRKNTKLLNCFLDSELVVKQLKGEYKVKNEDLIPLHKKIRELITYFSGVLFTYIPREENKKADMLVNNALDNI